MLVQLVDALEARIAADFHDARERKLAGGFKSSDELIADDLRDRGYEDEDIDILQNSPNANAAAVKLAHLHAYKLDGRSLASVRATYSRYRPRRTGTSR